MINQRPSPPDDSYYDEPEILPPERYGHGPRESGAWSRVFIDENGVRRVYISRVSPLGLISFSVLAGLVSIGLFFFFLSAFIFLVPLLALTIVGAGIMSLMRAASRR